MFEHSNTKTNRCTRRVKHETLNQVNTPKRCVHTAMIDFLSDSDKLSDKNGLCRSEHTAHSLILSRISMGIIANFLSDIGPFI